MHASCLCGAIEFQIGALTGSFELCHCNKCKKATGSAFNAVIDTNIEGYSILKGAEHIQTYKAPLLNSPPEYQVWFCKICGSPLPNPDPLGSIVEIPAGIINEEIELHPDKNVFVEFSFKWVGSISNFKSFTKNEYSRFRKKFGRTRIREAQSSE